MMSACLIYQLPSRLTAVVSSVIAEGESYWNGAGDRGDAAMNRVEFLVQDLVGFLVLGPVQFDVFGRNNKVGHTGAVL